MGLDRDIALLSEIPLFDDLSDEQLRLLAFSALRRDLEPGQVLFREGARATSGFVVTAGAVELSAGEDDGRRSLATCTPGTLIGEMALFVETTRRATAAAKGTSEVIEIERRLMTRMLTEYPGVAVRLRAKLASRLTATIGELGRVEAALNEIERRAAHRPG